MAVRGARVVTGWALGIFALIAGVAYICDSIYFQHEMKSANSADAFGSVEFYPATKLKNGKLDIYTESPGNEICVHALFPHNGYNPCWYAKRNPVHVVAEEIPRDGQAGKSSARSRNLYRVGEFSVHPRRHRAAEWCV